jgi:hypothetical protein
MWRGKGKIPHSVDSTAHIIEIIINDCSLPTASFGKSWRSESELRMMLSLAVIRAVNGLVDSLQQG